MIRATINKTFTAEPLLVGHVVEIGHFQRYDSDGYRAARIITDSDYMQDHTDGWVCVKDSHLDFTH